MGKAMTVPVVFLQPKIMENPGDGTILIDYERMGKLLADEMQKDIPADCPVWMLTDSAGQSSMDRLFLKGADSVFSAQGRTMFVTAWEPEAVFRTAMSALDENEKVVLLAENPEILTEVSGFLAENPTVADHVCGLYGRGSTVPILNNLDSGRISGICATDDFSIGYLSVRAAVQVLERADSIPVTAEIYYVEKENLREPDYEKLLFPIE